MACGKYNGREQAELMVSFGLVGEAMGVFEELELWNNLIDCYTYGFISCRTSDSESMTSLIGICDFVIESRPYNNLFSVQPVREESSRC